MDASKPRFIKTCPVCNSNSRQLFDVDHYIIRSCHVCAHQFTEMQADTGHADYVYTDAYFKGKAYGYPNYLGEAPFLKAKGRQYAQLISRYIRRPGRVLDVGAAAGFILEGFASKDWKGYGIEPNAWMVEQANQQFGLHITKGTLEDFNRSEKYDLITMIQVIAHFADLQAAFRVASEITCSDGLWLIETSNRDSLKARFWGRHWSGYRPPSTLRWFSPKDLQRLAAQFGFEEIARGKPRRWINVGHAKFSLRQQSKRSLWARLMLLVLTFVPDSCPMLYPSGDQFWVIYKKRW